MIEDRDVDSVFCAAIEIESEKDRAVYLDDACGDDAELRSRVDRLLEAHVKAGSFMADPNGSADTIDRQPIAEAPGTMIGPYKLLQELGEGGMGVVYMAGQTSPVKMRVALKIIKPGMDSRQVIGAIKFTLYT